MSNIYHINFKKNNLNSDFESFLINQSEFNKDLNKLKNGFKTLSPKFKYPTVLSKYRKGINPVKALFNFSQESYFKYETEQHKWMVNLLSDYTLINLIIKSLEEDIKSITTFIEKYKSVYTSYIISTIQELQSTRKDFIYYLEVFTVSHNLSDKP